MKTFCFFLPLLACFAAHAQLPSPVDYRIVERGLHHRVWQRVTVSTNLHGTRQAKTNSYTELGTAMHYESNGELLPADPSLELVEGHAVGRKTQHKVAFSANATDWQGVLHVTTPDNKEFRSRILGLSFYCSATDQSVLIAEVKDSVGVLQPNGTEIIYPDVLTDIKADLRYRNFKTGTEQDLIILENLPSPADYDLDPATTRLQLLSEMIESPAPARLSLQQEGATDDVTLDFGAMRIGIGKGFMAENQADSIKIEKQWRELAPGRMFLIEQVKWDTIEPYLEALPQPQAAIRDADPIRHVVSNKRLLPERKVAAVKDTRTIQVASVPREKTGFVLDYSLVTSQSDFEFQPDHTYFIDNTVILSGITTWNSSVLKFSTNEEAVVAVETNIFKTSPYRPAVFTSVHDSSIGEFIEPGDPSTNHCGYAGIYLFPSSVPTELKHVRFSHLRVGLNAQEASHPVTLRDVQFTHCLHAFDLWGAGINLYNGLIYDVDYGFYGQGALNAQHLTVHNCNTLAVGGSTNVALSLTNSLLVAVTNLGDYNILSNATVRLTSDDGVFQTVGNSIHYLVNGSPFRDVGTLSMEADLADSLANRTTFPPVVVLTNVTITNHMVIDRPVQRDTGPPDLGYHHDPIDVAMAHVRFSGARLLLTNGSTLGLFAKEATFGTLTLECGASFISEGAPDNLNHIVWHNAAQPQTACDWPGEFIDALAYDNYQCAGATIQSRFTAWTGASIGQGDIGWSGAMTLRDSEFRGAGLRLMSSAAAPPSYAYDGFLVSVTNCLFEHCTLSFLAFEPTTNWFFNNSFIGGTLNVEGFHGAPSTLTFKDNLFHQSSFAQPTNTIADAEYNAYVPHPTNDWHFIQTNSTDVFPGTFTFETGPLGHYYHFSTNVIDKGSRNATNAGLYHFTTRTTQARETNSPVDIGYHYVAVSGSVPLDSDNDGLADYREDANGNGTNENWESNWLDSDSDDDGYSDFVEWVQGRDPTSSSSTADSANSTKLQVFTPIE